MSYFEKQDTSSVPSVPAAGELVAQQPVWLETSNLGYLQQRRIRRVEAEATERLARKAIIRRVDRIAEIDRAQVDAASEFALAKGRFDHDNRMRSLRNAAHSVADESQLDVGRIAMQSARTLVEVLKDEKEKITAVANGDEEYGAYLDTVLRRVTQANAQALEYTETKFRASLRQSVDRQFLAE